MKVLEILSKIVTYFQNSDNVILNRLFSKSPKFFINITIYGGVLISVLTAILSMDLLPQYSEWTSSILKITIGIVGIAQLTKDKQPKDI